MESTIRAVIGTAGHVDHGKTTLISQMTGIETDRLVEEKRRGISIELGFAWLDLPEEAGRVAIIDVPGHERFVRQMIAGAAGIDLVLLVIAADEGVMPQTREHLDICQLLGVGAGAIVITKVDLVDDEWLELVLDDVSDAVAGTFLEGAPVARFAAGDPRLREQVVGTVRGLVAEADERGLLAQRSSDRPFKMSVDRSFSMRGFGTVVTGTTAAGSISVGEQVTLLPGGKVTRVRGIQRHEVACEQVGPGVRAAVNLQNVEHAEVHRGDVLARPGELATISMIDATFSALARLDSPVPDRTKVLLHIGTAQVEATLAFIGAQACEPGDRVAAQLRLSRPIAFLPGEPYVVRGFTVLEGYGKTLGGGRALLAQSRRHRRTSNAALALIEALAATDPARGVAALLEFLGDQGVGAQQLANRVPYARSDVAAALQSAMADASIVQAGPRLYHRSALQLLGQRVVAELARHHEAHPARTGLEVAELHTRIRADLPLELFQAVVARLETEGRVSRARDVYRMHDFTPRRDQRQMDAYQKVLVLLDEGGLTPPRVQDLPAASGLAESAVDEALVFAIEDDLAVRVTRELVFSRASLADLEQRLLAHFRAHETLDTTTFKLMTGASRKWTIPLGEYFDRVKLTVRVGDARRLRRGQ